tara:strand:+ start:2258 stop:2449 length:192 start_codon:yes stop_codon:yes gene_type:complete
MTQRFKITVKKYKAGSRKGSNLPIWGYKVLEQNKFGCATYHVDDREEAYSLKKRLTKLYLEKN